MNPRERERAAASLAQLLACDAVGNLIGEIGCSTLRDLMAKVLGRLVELRADARDEGGA